MSNDDVKFQESKVGLSLGLALGLSSSFRQSSFNPNFFQGIQTNPPLSRSILGRSFFIIYNGVFGSNIVRRVYNDMAVC